MHACQPVACNALHCSFAAGFAPLSTVSDLKPYLSAASLFGKLPLQGLYGRSTLSSVMQGTAESLLRDGQRAFEGAAQAAQEQLTQAQQRMQEGMAGSSQSARQAAEQAEQMSQEAVSRPAGGYTGLNHRYSRS